jgi:hypothetical protein
MEAFQEPIISAQIGHKDCVEGEIDAHSLGNRRDSTTNKRQKQVERPLSQANLALFQRFGAKGEIARLKGPLCAIATRWLEKIGSDFQLDGEGFMIPVAAQKLSYVWRVPRMLLHRALLRWEVPGADSVLGACDGRTR